jgi:hypothetical protein
MIRKNREEEAMQGMCRKGDDVMHERVAYRPISVGLDIWDTVICMEVWHAGES